MIVEDETDDYVLLSSAILFGEDEDILQILDAPVITSCILCVQSIPSEMLHNNKQGNFHVFDFSEYLNDIWTSFHQSSNKVIRQLQLDFKRQKYHVNDERCIDLPEYLKLINSINTIDTTNNKRSWNMDADGNIQVGVNPLDADLLLMMLSSQAVFAYTYEYLYKIFSFQNPHLHLIRINTDKQVCIFIKENVTMEIVLNCKLVDTRSDDLCTCKIITSTTYIDFSKPYAVIEYSSCDT